MFFEDGKFTVDWFSVFSMETLDTDTKYKPFICLFVYLLIYFTNLYRVTQASLKFNILIQSLEWCDCKHAQLDVRVFHLFQSQ